MDIARIYCNNFSPQRESDYSARVVKNTGSALLSLPEKEYSCPFSQTSDNIAIILKKEEEKLKELTDKYNLINYTFIQSKMLKDAQSVSKEYIKVYGLLTSLSREELLLLNYPKMQPRSSTRRTYEKMNQERLHKGNMNQLIDDTSRLVKKYKMANCGDCTMILSKMFYAKYKDKYDINTINYYATVGDRGVAHVALLLKSKDGTQEYVLDPWIAPDRGGIFKRKSWEYMIAKAYQISKDAQINIFTNDSIIKSLKKESK